MSGNQVCGVITGVRSGTTAGTFSTAFGLCPGQGPCASPPQARAPRAVQSLDHTEVVEDARVLVRLAAVVDVVLEVLAGPVTEVVRKAAGGAEGGQRCHMADPPDDRQRRLRGGLEVDAALQQLRVPGVEPDHGQLAGHEVPCAVQVAQEHPHRGRRPVRSFAQDAVEVPDGTLAEPGDVAPDSSGVDWMTASSFRKIEALADRG